MAWTLKVIYPDGGHLYTRDGSPIYFAARTEAEKFIREVKAPGKFASFIIVPID